MLQSIVRRLLSGGEISRDEADQLCRCSQQELSTAADAVRVSRMGKEADLCSIMNAKSGACPENCRYCAQSSHYSTGISETPLVSKEKALGAAVRMEHAGVRRFSLVTSGGALSEGEFDEILDLFSTLKEKTGLKLCASLGAVSEERARKLSEAGVVRYHHNLETGPAYYPSVCDTHTFEDRVRTILAVKRAGLSVCSGGILGMGESMSDRLDMAFVLRELEVDSVPLNILCPIPGTPFEAMSPLSPEEVLKTVALFRLILPKAQIRFGAGRASLGAAEAEGYRGGLNGAIVGDFLTTPGSVIADDIRKLREAGLELPEAAGIFEVQ